MQDGLEIAVYARIRTRQHQRQRDRSLLEVIADRLADFGFGRQVIEHVVRDLERHSKVAAEAPDPLDPRLGKTRQDGATVGGGRQQRCRTGRIGFHFLQRAFGGRVALNEPVDQQHDGRYSARNDHAFNHTAGSRRADSRTLARMISVSVVAGSPSGMASKRSRKPSSASE